MKTRIKEHNLCISNNKDCRRKLPDNFFQYWTQNAGDLLKIVANEKMGSVLESLRLPPNAGVSLAMSESWHVCFATV